MFTLKLNDEERAVLARILSEYYGELRMEIRDTEKWEYKDALKEEGALLDRLLTELSPAIGTK